MLITAGKLKQIIITSVSWTVWRKNIERDHKQAEWTGFNWLMVGFNGKDLQAEKRSAFVG
jgi:hypothetical protein